MEYAHEVGVPISPFGKFVRESENRSDFRGSTCMPSVWATGSNSDRVSLLPDAVLPQWAATVFKTMLFSFGF